PQSQRPVPETERSPCCRTAGQPGGVWSHRPSPPKHRTNSRCSCGCSDLEALHADPPGTCPAQCGDRQRAPPAYQPCRSFFRQPGELLPNLDFVRQVRFLWPVRLRHFVRPVRFLRHRNPPLLNLAHGSPPGQRCAHQAALGAHCSALPAAADEPPWLPASPQGLRWSCLAAHPLEEPQVSCPGPTLAPPSQRCWPPA